MKISSVAFVDEIVPVIDPQLYRADSEVIVREVARGPSFTGQVGSCSMLTTVDEVEDGVLLAFTERDMILAALGRHEGLPSRLRVGSCQASTSFIAASATTGKVQDEVLGCLDIGRVMNTVVLINEQAPLPQHDLVEVAGA